MSKNTNIKKGNESRFFNSDLLFSHNLIFNFVLGARSNGKTYEGRKKAIRRFIKTGEQFIWLRRRKSDIKETFFSFADEIENEFPNHDLCVVGNKLMIDGEVAGWGLALNGSSRLKSISFSNVWLIVYDEFLMSDIDRLNSNTGYLPGEAAQLLKFYDTVNRLKGTDMSNRVPVKVLMIANAESEYNPYFLHFGINMKDDSFEDGSVVRVHTNQHGTVAVQRFVSEELQESRRNSQFGSMIKNTSYGRHSLENEFHQDNSDFIVPKLPPNLQPICNINYDGMTIGFWYEPSTLTMYGSRKFQSTAITYTFNVEAHNENTVLLRNRTAFELRSVTKAWRNGAMKFDSLTARKHIETIFSRQG